MDDTLSRIFVPVGLVLTCFLGLYITISRPGYFSNATYLAVIVFIEILIVALWKYQKRFFPFLMIVFLWAGTDVPLNAAWISGRWFILAVGAIAGFVIYLANRDHFFGAWHMVAFFCAISALVSAMVSLHPQVALLKAASLLLLFIYGASGARIAAAGREASFFSELLLGCEILVYLSAIFYFVFHLEIYGNPNALGAVMSIGAMPILLWGVLIGEGTSTGRRRILALVLCFFLLFASYARAGIVAAIVSSIMLCIALRRYRLLIKGTAVVLLVASIAVAIVPLATDKPGEAQPESLFAALVYKGHESQGILGSRQSPWDDTLHAIQEHPWFGSGFGTSLTAYDASTQGGSYASVDALTREHGNSYLAIFESEGLLGIIPFFLMVCMIVFNVCRVVMWMRRTGSPFSPGVPLAAVMAAGLVHAIFEDWLFAVGSYLCVFFWTMAFILSDAVRSVAPDAEHSVSSNSPDLRSRWDNSYSVVSPRR